MGHDGETSDSFIYLTQHMVTNDSKNSKGKISYRRRF